MQGKYREKKEEGQKDTWRDLKLNPLYNTSTILKAAIDKATSAMSGEKPKTKKKSR